MENKICGFFGKYRWLSNFWPAKTVVGRFDWPMEEFPSVEQAYQALKCVKKQDWDKFVNSKEKGAKWAKHLSHIIEVRKDWPEVKLRIMSSLIRQKFSNFNPELKQKLIDTKDAYLEETNTWGDTYWGVCNRVGENHLGKLIMETRDILISQERWRGSVCIGCEKEDCMGDCEGYPFAERAILEQKKEIK